MCGNTRKDKVRNEVILAKVVIAQIKSLMIVWSYVTDFRIHQPGDWSLSL